MEGTVAAWIEAATHNRVYDEQLDAPRFRNAFTTLAATRTTWPSPADFITALPPREVQKQLPAKVNDPAKAAAQIMELKKLLYGKIEE